MNRVYRHQADRARYQNEAYRKAIRAIEKNGSASSSAGAILAISALVTLNSETVEAFRQQRAIDKDNAAYVKANREFDR